MAVTARTAVLLFTISLCCKGLPADEARDAWKKCSKASETAAKLRECSIAIESGTLPKDVVADALQIRASAHDEGGDYDLAIKDQDESVRMNPLAFRTFNNRGWEYIRKFDYKRAIQDFNQALQLSPKDDYAYANKGIAEFLSDDFADAEKDFAMAERLGPRHLRVYPALERVLTRLREAKEKGVAVDANAVKFEGDLTRWPGPIVAFYLGTISRDAVLRAAQPRPGWEAEWKHCEAYFFLGEHALIEGKREEAIELLQRAIDTIGTRDNPDYVWAQGELHNLRNSDGGITREKREMRPDGQDPAASTAAVETPADSRTNAVDSEKGAEPHAPGPGEVRTFPVPIAPK